MFIVKRKLPAFMTSNAKPVYTGGRVPDSPVPQTLPHNNVIPSTTGAIASTTGAIAASDFDLTDLSPTPKHIVSTATKKFTVENSLTSSSAIKGPGSSGDSSAIKGPGSSGDSSAIKGPGSSGGSSAIKGPVSSGDSSAIKGPVSSGGSSAIKGPGSSGGSSAIKGPGSGTEAKEVTFWVGGYFG